MDSSQELNGLLHKQLDDDQKLELVSCELSESSGFRGDETRLWVSFHECQVQVGLYM